jgi:ATP synthase subunit 6
VGWKIEIFKVISPLEQFNILPIIQVPFLTITNATIILFLTVLFFVTYIKMFAKGDLTPTYWQITFESIYDTALDLAYSSIGEKGSVFFPLTFILFLFILFCNLIGMIPYSFTVTSHLIVTFALALTTFLGFNIIGIKKHKSNFLNLLLPSGSSLALVPLLVPIELVSYIFRVISLPVRLFANLMAGHTLLKVIAGFAWSMLTLGGIMLILHFIPLFLLVLLFGLEIGVALIQAYVFTILTCMYISDALNLH